MPDMAKLRRMRNGEDTDEDRGRYCCEFHREQGDPRFRMPEDNYRSRLMANGKEVR